MLFSECCKEKGGILPCPGLWPFRKKDAIFIWIPKCAGSSICAALQEHGMYKCNNDRDPFLPFPQKGMVTFGHASIPALQKANFITPKFYKRAFKFAFVRNPFDRMVSLFHYSKKVKREQVPETMTFEEFCKLIERKEHPPVGLYNYLGLSQCNPMVDWILNEHDHLIVDFVGRYENLKADFSKICRVLGIKEELPHVNSTEHAWYREHYTPETRAIVEKLYKKDLDYFSYIF